LTSVTELHGLGVRQHHAEVAMERVGEDVDQLFPQLEELCLPSLEHRQNCRPEDDVELEQDPADQSRQPWHQEQTDDEVPL